MSTAAHHYTLDEIFFSCTEKRYLSKESFVPEHGISHIYSGEVTVIEENKRKTFRAGDTIFFRRNYLANSLKQPAPDAPFKSITIFFTQPFLKNYYAVHPVKEPAVKITEGYSIATAKYWKNNLFTSFFDSLAPYYDFSGPLSEDLIQIKLAEAITILRTIDPGIDVILSEFSEPGKIDLEDFMLKNYYYNVPIERLSYLTGRSLATFKRDFKKLFDLPPQKWLIQKRLKQAHFLITEQKQKPSEVYVQVGFESLSHFSVAFKQQFGYNPSTLY
jgi:AraC family transcriptional regulator, exoenzyme S synthesis regulatory protein ExsA